MAEGRCSFCRMVNLALTMAFLGIGGYLLWFYLGEPSVDDIKAFAGNFSDFSDVLDSWGDIDISDLWDGDPFLSDNSTNSWPTNGEGGLTLTLLNALDDTWQEEFAVAVDDWENGDPDPLTLEVTQGEIDNICTPKDDVMKVCNGNYGESGWLGINQILKTVPAGIIQSSVAKMNEYYLLNSDNAERQYTMCHEIGHGFGLPHTDESFTNPSLGNCMDYTHTPSENMHPDESNYLRLAGLYGTVGNRRLQGGRDLMERPRRLSPESQAEYELAVRELENLRKMPKESSGWRLLREHDRGAEFARALGEEHVLEVRMLYATLN